MFRSILHYKHNALSLILLYMFSCRQMGLFNFRPSVRPVPLEVHIHGFPGKHYCPRMATMNKPAYQGLFTYDR